MSVNEEVESKRANIASLREEIAQEKAAQRQQGEEITKADKVKALTAEEDRLLAELASLRGHEPEPPEKVGDFVVPMGTKKIDTDVIQYEKEETEVKETSIPRSPSGFNIKPKDSSVPDVGVMEFPTPPDTDTPPGDN